MARASKIETATSRMPVSLAAAKEEPAIRLYLSGGLNKDFFENPDVIVVFLRDQTIERLQMCAQLCTTHRLSNICEKEVLHSIHYADEESECTPRWDYTYLEIDSLDMQVVAFIDDSGGWLKSVLVNINDVVKDYRAARKTGKSFLIGDDNVDRQIVARYEAEELRALMQAEAPARTTRKKIRGL